MPRRNEYCKKPNKSIKGTSLLEIILALAILGILATAFFSVFTGSYANVFTTGKKNQAVALAASRLELLYARNTFNLPDSSMETLLKGVVVPAASPALYQYTPGTELKFSRQKNVPLAGGETVTIVVFYLNGTRHVALSGYTKGGG